MLSQDIDDLIAKLEYRIYLVQSNSWYSLVDTERMVKEMRKVIDELRSRKTKSSKQRGN